MILPCKMRAFTKAQVFILTLCPINGNGVGSGEHGCRGIGRGRGSRDGRNGAGRSHSIAFSTQDMATHGRGVRGRAGRRGRGNRGDQDLNRAGNSDNNGGGCFFFFFF